LSVFDTSLSLFLLILLLGPDGVFLVGLGPLMDGTVPDLGVCCLGDLGSVAAFGCCFLFSGSAEVLLFAAAAIEAFCLVSLLLETDSAGDGSEPRGDLDDDGDED
jgi:hypothetical protein